MNKIHLRLKRKKGQKIYKLDNKWPTSKAAYSDRDALTDSFFHYYRRTTY